jgi:hypothetical protein
MLGLLYTILSTRDIEKNEKVCCVFQSNRQFYQYLNWVVKDRFAWCATRLNRLIIEKWTKLTDLCRIQVGL